MFYLWHNRCHKFFKLLQPAPPHGRSWRRRRQTGCSASGATIQAAGFPDRNPVMVPLAPLQNLGFSETGATRQSWTPTRVSPGWVSGLHYCGTSGTITIPAQETPKPYPCEWFQRARRRHRPVTWTGAAARPPPHSRFSDVAPLAPQDGRQAPRHNSQTGTPKRGRNSQIRPDPPEGVRNLKPLWHKAFQAFFSCFPCFSRLRNEGGIRGAFLGNTGWGLARHNSQASRHSSHPQPLRG